MAIKQGNINDYFLPISGSTESISTFFHEFWFEINNKASFFEMGIIIAIVFLSYLLQKWGQWFYYNRVVKDETPTWSQQLIYAILPLTSPVIAFFLFSCVLSISASLTQNLAIYKVSINLSLVWFTWILVSLIIPNVWVRRSVMGVLIPFLLFSAFGLSAPILHYLNSLNFSLAGVNISISLMIKALLIATCLFSVARLLSKSMMSFIESQKKINPEIRDLIENLFQIALYTIVTLIAFDLVGIDLSSLALVGGAVGIGIGIGLQKIAANFISGIIILFEQNVKVGHFVEVPGGGNPGWIRHLGARAAIIDTGDGKELLIPNEELLTKTVIDWTGQGKATRTDLLIKVSFNSNLEKAKEIMLEAALSHPVCSKRLSPSCYLEKFTDNGAQFVLQFWVDDLSVGKAGMQNDVLLTIWRRFAEENITLPMWRRFAEENMTPV